MKTNDLFDLAETNPPPYDSVGRPPDYQEEDPFYDPGLKEFAQAGFRFLEMSGSSYQKRQGKLLTCSSLKVIRADYLLQIQLANLPQELNSY